MDQSTLIIILALTTFALVLLWAARSRRNAEKGRSREGRDQPARDPAHKGAAFGPKDDNAG